MTSEKIQEILEYFTQHRSIARNITHWKVINEKPPQFADFPASLSPQLVDILKARGIEQLYSHQAESINRILKGENTVVVTPTASGKTLCYNLPVVESIVKDEDARSLYLFPTKALSQDQFGELYEITNALNRKIKAYTFDGDTPATARKAIRTAGHIVITNPDMLHTGILPHHTLWIKLFENLKYIVIDEIHHYRGVFGSHFANVMRRLKRICEFYNSHPVFICCSATIANPVELTETLIGEKVSLVDNNGAPQGRKHFVFYNPPVVNEELGIRKSVIKEASYIAERFIINNVQTIVFARSRLRVEILTAYLKRAMKRLKLNPDRIKGYRGGYLPNERREIEQGVKKGEILGVVSTNALELGIDIGQLNASVLAGFPGTISSTWQQGGRAGRKKGESVVVLVANSSPMDQFIIKHPEYFFGASPEMGIINPNNFPILVSHIKCAAFELPFVDGEKFGDTDITPILEHLDRENVIHHAGDKWYWSSDVYPAEDISLRSATVENFVVVDTTYNNKIIAEVDYDSTPYFIHENAIYMHQSQPYYIDKLDWEARTAYARKVDVDYYTDAQAKTDIKVLTVDRHYEYKAPTTDDENIESTEKPHKAESCLESKNFGDISVTTIIAKFKKIKFMTHENIGYGDIHLPEQEMQTESFWLTFILNLKEQLAQKKGDLGSGLNSLATLLSNVIPIYAMCDPLDIYVIPMIRAPFDNKPAIYIYDRYPGGVGISKKLYDLDQKILLSALDMLKQCGCHTGCPSCVGPAGEIGEKGKFSARLMLENVIRNF